MLKNFFESELCVILRLSGSNREREKREREILSFETFLNFLIGSVVRRVWRIKTRVFLQCLRNFNACYRIIWKSLSFFLKSYFELYSFRYNEKK